MSTVCFSGAVRKVENQLSDKFKYAQRLFAVSFFYRWNHHNALPLGASRFCGPFFHPRCVQIINDIHIHHSVAEHLQIRCALSFSLIPIHQLFSLASITWYWILYERVAYMISGKVAPMCTLLCDSERITETASCLQSSCNISSS